MQKNINEKAQQQRRKEAKRSAILSSIYIILVSTLLIGLQWYYKIEGIWRFIMLLVAVIDLLSIIPIGILLKTRLKEIEGGEEDVATQY